MGDFEMSHNDLLGFLAQSSANSTITYDPEFFNNDPAVPGNIMSAPAESTSMKLPDNLQSKSLGLQPSATDPIGYTQFPEFYDAFGIAVPENTMMTPPDSTSSTIMDNSQSNSLDSMHYGPSTYDPRGSTYNPATFDFFDMALPEHAMMTPPESTPTTFLNDPQSELTSIKHPNPSTFDSAGLNFCEPISPDDFLFNPPSSLALDTFIESQPACPQYYNIEVPEVGEIRLPPFVGINDPLDTHDTKAIISNTTWTLISVAAIINLCVYLNEIDDSYDAVTSVEFVGLEMLEIDVFRSNATELLQRCQNVQNVNLTIDLNDLIFSYEGGVRAIDMHAMGLKYDFAAITALPELKSVTLALKPFMALEKRLLAIEEEKNAALSNGLWALGVEQFWGMKDWFEFPAGEPGRFIIVTCPSLPNL
ncbi:hypothetical protein BU24DRAFT_407051 [Aaosphaeria arxii CBS 175.79]|uniref:Uncharacterized protein n=1 Tax=Aaosphaeria arxii CBS 175.79 TaxID=1450172 RepID=A0A6A5XUS0_9PLEO|nr:uncharacterized protein BU24DRAFT_407051 [Aaosphaeria arxii CBS 175.79]KAF2016962.1 hypothetical protein BU24DRAFT_407051 [Aaosphaeria arxii CBS 175.79]